MMVLELFGFEELLLDFVVFREKLFELILDLVGVIGVVLGLSWCDDLFDVSE